MANIAVLNCWVSFNSYRCPVRKRVNIICNAVWFSAMKSTIDATTAGEIDEE